MLNIPWLLLLGAQISFNNARAAFEALLRQSSEFVRTPKSGEDNQSIPAKVKRYKTGAPKGAIFEFSLAIVFMSIFSWCVNREFWFLLPFTLLFIIGYLSTSISSFISYQKLKN